MSIFIGAVLPCITITVFVGGMIYRIYTWSSLASPKMTLFPAPESGKERFIEVLKETFLFKNLFNSDKNLWLLSWLFHAMLALIFVGHFRVLSWLPDKMLMLFGLSKETINTMSTVAGGFAGIVILVCLVIILLRRALLERVKEISEPGDYFALFLIIFIIVTGDAMRFFSHMDLSLTRQYFLGLFTFSSITLPSNGWFLVHYLAGQVLFIYIPFSKILHFGGIFFAQSLVHKH